MALPTYSHRLAALGSWYVPRHIGRHFHAVRCDRDGLPPVISGPTVFFMNHASWWDPLIGALFVARRYAKYRHYTPIDAQAVRKYPIMLKFGFFSIDKNPRRGAAQFLEISREVLHTPDAVMWLTPEGRFRDIRVRPVQLRPGIGHLAALCPEVRLVPIAIEYTFWQESLPEAIVRFGQGVSAKDHPDLSPADWTAHLAVELQGEMDALAENVKARDASAFDLVQRGREGVGGIYDLIRRGKALATGRPFLPAHEQEQP